VSFACCALSPFQSENLCSARRFPTPLDATNQDNVFVGRVRQDLSQVGRLVHVCGHGGRYMGADAEGHTTGGHCAAVLSMSGHEGQYLGLYAWPIQLAPKSSNTHATHTHAHSYAHTHVSKHTHTHTHVSGHTHANKQTHSSTTRADAQARPGHLGVRRPDQEGRRAQRHPDCRAVVEELRASGALAQTPNTPDCSRGLALWDLVVGVGPGLRPQARGRAWGYAWVGRRGPAQPLSGSAGENLPGGWCGQITCEGGTSEQALELWCTQITCLCFRSSGFPFARAQTWPVLGL